MGALRPEVSWSCLLPRCALPSRVWSPAQDARSSSSESSKNETWLKPWEMFELGEAADAMLDEATDRVEWDRGISNLAGRNFKRRVPGKLASALKTGGTSD